MTELYVIVKKFSDEHVVPYYATFSRENANRIWNECIKAADRIYYDFEFRKYLVKNFEIIKKRNKNT